MTIKITEPEQEFNIGAVKVTIWHPQSNQDVHHVTFSRYTKAADGWQDTQSFTRDDLLKVLLLASDAFDYLLRKA